MVFSTQSIVEVTSEGLTYRDETGKEHMLDFETCHALARKQINTGMLKYVARGNRKGDWTHQDIPYLEFTTLPPVRFLCADQDDYNQQVARIQQYGWYVQDVTVLS